METILFIEDSHELRYPIAETLRLEGYAVLEADDGLDAMGLLVKRPVDLVICDIMMPQMDGYEVLSQVRAKPEMTDVPFIFLTAKTEMVDIRRGMQLTADDYLIKPVKTEYLLQSIKAQIKRAQLKREAIAKRLLGVKESVARMLPHELMTPLTAILALSEYLSGEKDVDGVLARELAKDIHASGMRLLSMIKNYLVYSELSLLLEQEMPVISDVEVEECDIDTHFNLWVKGCAHLWGREEDLFCDVGEGVVEAKPTYMEHLVLQLLDNAFKFSQKGQRVYCSIFMEGHSLVINISDKGRGMSQDEINEVGLFQQFDRKRYEQQGSGIGLAIVQRVLRLHGGELKFEGRPGKGVEVDVKMPTDPSYWKFTIVQS